MWHAFAHCHHSNSCAVQAFMEAVAHDWSPMLLPPGRASYGKDGDEEMADAATHEDAAYAAAFSMPPPGAAASFRQRESAEVGRGWSPERLPCSPGQRTPSPAHSTEELPAHASLVQRGSFGRRPSVQPSPRAVPRLSSVERLAGAPPLSRAASAARRGEPPPDVDHVHADVAARIEGLLRDPSYADALLHARHGAGTGAPMSASPGRSDSGASGGSGGGRQGECTDANKHVVAGALDMLDSLKHNIAALAEREPLVAKAQFLLAMVLQRFEPPEVKEMAGIVINNVSAALVPLARPGGPANAALYRDVIELLADKTRGSRLHWRESAVAEVLFTMTAPLVPEGELLHCIVAAQVHDLLEGHTSIAKVRLPCGALSAAAADAGGASRRRTALHNCSTRATALSLAPPRTRYVSRIRSRCAGDGLHGAAGHAAPRRVASGKPCAPRRRLCRHRNAHAARRLALQARGSACRHPRDVGARPRAQPAGDRGLAGAGHALGAAQRLRAGARPCRHTSCVAPCA
jgi:hypothetical protein